MCPEDRCTINTNQPFVISLTSKTLELPTPGWVRMERKPALVCVMMEDTSRTWPAPTGAWSSLLLSGVVVELTWVGWTASLAVEENVILTAPASPSPTLSCGNKLLIFVKLWIKELNSCYKKKKKKKKKK